MQQSLQTHRSKVIAAWLAFLFGVFGTQGWYLGRRRAWCVTAFTVACLLLSRLYPSWWDNPPFLLLIFPMLAGFIEALVLALKPDAWFDARHNTGSDATTHTGGNAVIVAICTTLVGSAVLLFWIAMVVMHVYEAMGWLDGLNY